MLCQILEVKPSEFTGKKGEVIKGATLLMLREKDKQTKSYWVSIERLQKMGFSDQMVSNPFDDDDPQLVEVSFDEGRNNKITPISLKLVK